MPRCKNCAHPESKHWGPGHVKFLAVRYCDRCAACPGYEPSRGARQRRRTPVAAIKRIADELWSALVKNRPRPNPVGNWPRVPQCEITTPHQCKGDRQAMHGIPRTYAATRWLPINGFDGCEHIHLYYTKRPEEWSAYLVEAWGLETFRELWRIARAMQPVDLDAAVARLREELGKVK